MSKKNIYQVQRQQNVLWLRAAVKGNNNTPLLVRLLIDTGASYTVIPRKILGSTEPSLQVTPRSPGSIH